MKYLLIILFSTSLFAQSIIYQTGFETGVDGWKKGNPYQNCGTTPERVGITYTINPFNSYMLNVCVPSSYSDLACVTPLNMKAGRTYSFSLKYNRVSGSIADTIMICQDSIKLTLPYLVRLTGTTDYVLATTPQGTSDSNWRTVTFNQTPTQNGGYLHIKVTAGTEFMLDNISITGDTTTHRDTLTFISPSQNSVHSGGDTLHLTWTASKDSVRLRYLGLTQYVNGVATYDIPLPDSTFALNIYGNIINPLTGSTIDKDTLTVLIYKNGYLHIDTVTYTNPTVTIKTISLDVDSIKYYVGVDSTNWIYLGYKTVVHTYDVDTTIYTKNLLTINGGNFKYAKVVEYRDTTGWIYTSRDMNLSASGSNLGSPHTLDGCFIWEGVPWNLRYLWNRGCGWVTSISTLQGVANVSSVSTNLVASFSYSTYPDSINMHNYCDDSYITTGKDSTTFNGWGFKVVQLTDSVMIKVTDILRNVSRYFNITNLVSKSQSGYDPTSSSRLNYPLVIEIRNTGNTVIDSCTGVTHNYSSTIMFLGNSPSPAFSWTSDLIGSWHGSPSLPFGISTNYPVFYVLQLTDVFNSAPSSTQPLLQDMKTMSNSISVIRNNFRGIHPKIWKYGNINGTPL